MSTPATNPSTAPAAANPPAATPRTYTEAEFTAAVESARAESAANIKGLETQVAELTSTTTQLKDSLELLSKVKKGDQQIDIHALTKEIAQRAKDAAAVSTSASEDALRKEIATLRQEIAAKELAATRERLIAEAGGPEKLIMKLVTGNTEAELIANIAESKSIHDTIYGKAIASVPAPTVSTSTAPAAAPAAVAPALAPAATAPAPTAEPPPTVDASPSATDQGAHLIKAPSSRVKPRDWGAQREQTLAQLQGRYPNA